WGACWRCAPIQIEPATNKAAKIVASFKLNRANSSICELLNRRNTFAGQASNDRNCNPLVYLRVDINFNRRVSRSQGNERAEDRLRRSREVWATTKHRELWEFPEGTKKEYGESKMGSAYPRTRTALKFSTTRPPSRGRPKLVCGRKRE